ncbi:Heat shock factor protein [Leucoagaricus sp. SymC.cos]|nr:Heat shock factor protein [Leucoagaricus sp. SymC.cos]
MDSFHHQHWDAYPSLSLSSLNVASPPNLSPATPLSPYHHQLHQPHQFNFDHQNNNFDDRNSQQQSSQPSSSSRPSTSAGLPPQQQTPSSATAPLLSLPLPRKRSSSCAASTLVHVEESIYDDSANGAPNQSLDLATPSEDHEMRSPIDGSGSNSGAEDGLAYGGSSTPGGLGDSRGTGAGGMPMGMAGSMNILGKPMATNNFVTKLYQMINDPKSAHFIAWTELGTSFVVSNVGEFSRTILGSHFKHNNFSSFVRQLNMYGFHKINRTPRAQRTSTDAQTWEFSHHKFLRGRPDLLDEIKRKALEPDPTIKHRVELPGEVAAQLGAIRDENRRLWDTLNMERKKSEKLVGLVNRLWDVVQKGFPGSMPPFPSDFFSDSNLSTNDNPNIYITSPTSASARYPPPLSINFNQPLHSIPSPSSSPTSTDFPHQHHPTHPSLSRQQSFQPVGFASGGQAGTPGAPTSRPTDATETANASSPSAMEGVYDDENSTGPGNGVNGAQNSGPRGSGGVKRQRLSTDEGGTGMGGLGVNVNMNGYHHHLQPHGYAAAAAHHAHHLGDVSTVSSPGTTAPPSLLGVPGIGGVPIGSAVGGVGGVKRSSRARSDSAPLGPYSYGSSNAAAAAAAAGTSSSNGSLGVGPSWLGGRPRSGSGLMTLNRPGTGAGGAMFGRNMGNLSGLAGLGAPPTGNPAGAGGPTTGGAPPPGPPPQSQQPGVDVGPQPNAAPVAS